jgi:hypothetical protein
MAAPLNLPFEPLGIFRRSKTPVGLYARQKWLDQSHTPQWKEDFEDIVASLRKEQLPDGSWSQSATETITRLFGLHLTVRSSDDGIDGALAWLIQKIDLTENGILVRDRDGKTIDNSTSLPFTADHPDMLIVAGALFLSTIFGHGHDPAVTDIYRWLTHGANSNWSRWHDRAATHNILRAMVVHPDFAGHPVTIEAVDMLARFQRSSGEWGSGIPFHQIVNALAHLDTAAAEIQLERAFHRLAQTQKGDGSWGHHNPEWNTFLSVHALKNKGYL